MSDLLAYPVVWLNTLANALGGVLLAPVAMMPGWLSATLVAIVTGVLMLYAFKYTSNQRAIKRVRDDIKANLFALKLFKDNTAVTLKAQVGLFANAFWLLAFALLPMLVMLIPVTLILGQLALWYQARPLREGEDALVMLRLNGDAQSTWPSVQIQSDPAFEVTTGPVRIQSQRSVCWKLTANKAPGYHRLVFKVDGQDVEKDLAIGDGFMRVSLQRPGWSWSDALVHPDEAPFRPDSPVKAIEIDYPNRSSWTSGTDHWVIYWFATSFVAALVLRKPLGVNV